MHDIRLVREAPDAFDRALATRGLEPKAAELIALDDARKEAVSQLQTAQERRNALSREIGAAKKARDEERAQALMNEVANLKEAAPHLAKREDEANIALQTTLAGIPNLPADGVPIGADEAGNVERHRYGTPRELPNAREHFEIGETLGGMDFARAAKISGARFVALTGQIARLERALGQFMLDLHTTEHGYVEVAPPVLVHDKALFGTAQLPKFKEDLFETNDGLWLIPTAEVSLTNLVAGEILAEKDLPLRYTALTPCFRREAGSAGRDVRGLIRQHQFMKCELVAITTPDRSAEEHERMLASAEEVLKRLDLPYRVMTLCTGDMGFAAAKTYDIEVWLPGQGTYREISSCSVCGDFQARRMDARFRPAGGQGTCHLHTLNGSGLAVGRALVAVLENYQNDDGSVTIPDVLRPYMGGTEKIDVPTI